MGLKWGISELETLQRYRRDRIELLSFILSVGILEKVVLPPGVLTLHDVDLDQVSVDYVLDCARKAGVLELCEAIKRYHDDLNLPPATDSGSRESHFLVTDSELSGPPSGTVPRSFASEDLPSVVETACKTLPLITTPAQQPSTDDNVGGDNGDDNEEEGQLGAVARRLSNDASDLVLDLPSFKTGLSDDDLRETAYEVLLASVGGAGGLISPAKEKSSKVVRRVRSSSSRLKGQPTRAPGLAGLLETMRIQMEISEATDRQTREALLRAAAGRVGKRMDTLLVPLELLCVVSQEDFPDRISFLQWKKRQLNLLEEGLLNHPGSYFDATERFGADLRILIERVEAVEAVPFPAGPAQHAEALKALRGVATALAEGVGSGDQSGEFCHWADGYHLNVRLYEMLLSSVFDRLDGGQIVEEVEEILELLKSTWRVLGVTQTVHDTCYTWVLFRQFVMTGEAALLQHATQQMKRIASDGQRSAQERSYMKSLRATAKNKESSQELTYVQSVLIPIKLWADKRLEDYHLHFPEALDTMDALVTVAMIASRLIADEIDQIGSNKSSSTVDMVAVAKQAKEYISSSVALAFERALETVDSKWEAQNEHPLALLAEELQALAKKDASMFAPILNRWHPQAQAISASLLHRLYQRELKPFVDGVSNLTEDVTSVLPAADSLEEYLKGLVLSVSDEGSNTYQQEMVPYQVEVVASNLSMQWVNTQLSHISQRIDQAINEENWESSSSGNRCGSSIFEVFQLIEETVNQFFDLKLPMRIPLLRSLMNGLDSALQLYANRMVAQLGNIADLIPPVPTLTRYKKDTVVKAFSKKKPVELKLLDEKRSSDINLMTTTKLCVRLNTLYYLSSQMDALEEKIKERWSAKRPNDDLTSNITFSRRRPSDGDLRLRHLSRSSEEFSIGFESSRKVVTISINKISEFTGVKLIFWDMRESFIDGLYKVSVSQARMVKVVNGLDSVLGQLCEMIVEPLRDQVVMALLQASLDGLLRVLLDGGSSRSFSQSDGELLEEDLSSLKNFFIAEGDGLPKTVVDSAATPIQQVLDLYKVETWIVIENFKHASDLVDASSNSRKGGMGTPSDADMLLRVLCHRTDREASKFLKKQYKLPKIA